MQQGGIYTLLQTFKIMTYWLNKVVSVSKKEYIEHLKERLKRVKKGLIYYKVETTKEINRRMKRIAEIEKELNELE